MKTVRKIQLVDDIKIKSKVTAFFLPLPVYLPFIALLSLLFSRLQGLKKALNFSEIKVQLNSHLASRRSKNSTKSRRYKN